MPIPDQLNQPHEVPPSAALAEMIRGYQRSQALYVAAKLGIADLLKEGPKRCEELALATGTHARSLYRVLRYLASIGVFTEGPHAAFALTPLAAGLQTGVPGSQRAMAIMNGEEHYRTWGEMLYSVTTGEPAFNNIFGQGLYAYLAHHPEANTYFNEAQTAGTVRALPDILEAYDFSGIGTLVDLGGGRGLFLTGILQKYPRMQGVLLDLPHVVAEAPPVLQAAGVGDRCRIVSGDFLADLPSDADAYMLKNIVSDMRDAEAVQVFRACHATMGRHSRLLVISTLIGTGAAAGPAAQTDLHMMVIFGEAGVRTEEELRALLAASGFQVTRIVPAGRAGAIVEALPM